MIFHRAFKEEDIHNINPVFEISDFLKSEVINSPCAWTVLKDDEPVCIWGKVHMWKGRGILWAFMGEGSRKCMKGLVRVGRETIAEMEEDRLEATVSCALKTGARFMELLGFTRECTMRKYAADGTDEYLFARVR